MPRKSKKKSRRMPCKSNQYRSSTTGRCRTRKSEKSRKKSKKVGRPRKSKKCRSGQVKDRTTKKCRSKKKSGRKASKYSRKSCSPGRTRNKSGHCVLKKGCAPYEIKVGGKCLKRISPGNIMEI